MLLPSSWRDHREAMRMRVADFLTQTGLRWVYHFTDIQNLPLIREHGLLPRSELARRDCQPPKPGGDERSRATDAFKGLSGFVHLCFKDEHPMEWVARNEGRLGETLFLEIDAQVLLRDGVLGCPGLVNAGGARILLLEEALDLIDLDVLFGGGVDFRDPTLVQRWNVARKAEILVPGVIATDQIGNLG